MTANSNNQIIEIGPDGLVEVVQGICEHVQAGFESIREFLNSEQVQGTLELAKDVDEVAEECFSKYKLIKKIPGIPSWLYLRKLDKFLLGLIDIPMDKRQKYVKAVGKKQFNKNTVYILEIINRIEDMEKIDLLLEIFKLRMDDTLNDSEFRRMMLMTASTMTEDLRYMASHITKGYFEITSPEEEGLESVGWIIYGGMAWSETSENDGGNLYRYTATAMRYCKLVLDIEAGNTDGAGPVRFVPSEATEEDIADMFK